jgi:hypothetical protein
MGKNVEIQSFSTKMTPGPCFPGVSIFYKLYIKSAMARLLACKCLSFWVPNRRLINYVLANIDALLA